MLMFVNVAPVGGFVNVTVKKICDDPFADGIGFGLSTVIDKVGDAGVTEAVAVALGVNVVVALGTVVGDGPVVAVGATVGDGPRVGTGVGV